jgi:hypothetical protein
VSADTRRAARQPKKDKKDKNQPSCFYCQQPGHKVKDCKQKEEDTKSKLIPAPKLFENTHGKGQEPGGDSDTDIWGQVDEGCVGQGDTRHRARKKTQKLTDM